MQFNVSIFSYSSPPRRIFPEQYNVGNAGLLVFLEIEKAHGLHFIEKNSSIRYQEEDGSEA